jgi:hypothetical protein
MKVYINTINRSTHMPTNCTAIEEKVHIHPSRERTSINAVSQDVTQLHSRTHSSAETEKHGILSSQAETLPHSLISYNTKTM